MSDSPALAELAELIRSVRRNKRKRLRFVVGDGIHPVQELLNPPVIRERLQCRLGRAPSFEEEAVERWKHYEYARFQTANCCPGFGYYMLSQLVAADCVESIITTNYDLYFDSLIERRLLRAQRNPILAEGEYASEGYHSHPSSENSIPIWKIHGSLSHCTFTNCALTDIPHIFQLPRFAILNDLRPLRKWKSLHANHDHLWHIGKAYKITSLQDEVQSPSLASHFLDWAYEGHRAAFSREIATAKQHLTTGEPAALVIVGFTGFHSTAPHPYNEEIVPTILSSSNAFPIFYLLHADQRARLANNYSGQEYPLYDLLMTDPRRSDVFDDSGQWLALAAERAGLGTLDDHRLQYTWEWVQGRHFLPREQLPHTAEA